MMLAFLMYLMMQKQAMTPSQPIKAGDCLLVMPDETLLKIPCGSGGVPHEAGEYPAIKREQVHMMDWADCPIGFDQGSDEDGSLCTPNPRYTCKSPDTEVLEFTVSGRAFCRKVGQ